jgi:hypothetical protein
MKALDPPIIVGIVLLLLAIIPPNIVVLRRGQRAMPAELPREKPGPRMARPRIYATESANRTANR